MPIFVWTAPFGGLRRARGPILAPAAEQASRIQRPPSLRGAAPTSGCVVTMTSPSRRSWAST
eukprot:8928573-Pyramimonas_sp.AAC.1